MNGAQKIVLLKLGLVIVAATFGIFAILHNGVFAWFCFIPFFFALQGMGPKQAAKYGAFAGAIIGVIPALGLSRYGIGVIIAISLYAMCYGAIFGAATGLVGQQTSRYRWILFLPMVWVSLEFMRTLSPLSLPSNLAISQYENIPLLQISTITGPYGVSFVLVLVNCVLYRMLKAPKMAFAMHNRKFTTFLIVAVTGILFLPLVYSFHLRSDTLIPKRGGIKVAIVQGSIPIERYRAVNKDYYSKKFIRDRYFNLTGEAKKSGADLIVWPEGVLAEYAMQEPSLKEKLQAVSQDSGAFFIAGIPSQSDTGTHNTVYVFSPSGQVIGQYDKINLVPYFEEYIPGKKSPVINTALAQFGVAICFESIYPRIVRRLTREGAQVLFILTNDAGFGRSKLVDFHAREAVFRAVENRRYIVRAAQSGISMLIDPMGRILKKTEEFEKTILMGNVWPNSQDTFYAKYGDVFVYLCILGSVTMCFFKKSGGVK
ncbi:MAG: apolipoprotein N-acyltransferase [Candidatus Omnitrophota bacterium]|nr:MAG: apolipoprotein N-acyltransferase [Candidatus Omnitrophota bacterium]